MERKLATIEKILDINPIEGADAIEVTTVRGWQVIIRKGEYNIGDLCIYCEVDCLLPIRPEFEFLRKSCYKKMADGTEGFRLKTIKLRSQISQGLILPVSILNRHVNESNIGDDVSEELNIIKYEPPVPAELSGISKGNFPSFLIKTDQERCISGDTTVITEDGIKTIKNICEEKYNGKVKSYNEIFNKIEYNSIKNHNIMNNNNDWYEIETELGYRIQVTSNHKIYIPSLSCYREVRDLNINDDILIFSEKY